MRLKKKKKLERLEIFDQNLDLRLSFSVRFTCTAPPNRKTKKHRGMVDAISRTLEALDTPSEVCVGNQIIERQ